MHTSKLCADIFERQAYSALVNLENSIDKRNNVKRSHLAVLWDFPQHSSVSQSLILYRGFPEPTRGVRTDGSYFLMEQ